MVHDKKATIFFFFMTLILLDFGNQIRNLIHNSYFINYSNFLFSIKETTNSGISFGFFENTASFVSILGIVVVAIIFYLIIKNANFSNKTKLISLTLFSAGILGNALERYNNGYVVDYIKLNFINFPIFNTFDIMITLGCFLYVIFVLFKNEKQESNNEDNN